MGKESIALSAAVRQAASRDYAWLSPVLTEVLPQAWADGVVYPRTPEEVLTVLQLAYDFDVPVTPRSKGTGNYGQAVPLHQGVVLDVSRLNQIIAVETEWIHAEAGVNFIKLEAAARATGQELALYPSTMNSYLSGFICGGAGGTGSVENGFIWDENVQRVKVANCCESSELFWAEGAEALPYLHAYGCTGIVTEVKLKLCPAREWTAVFASFAASEWRSATDVGLELMSAERKPRLLSIDQPAFVDYFPEHEWMPRGRISLRTIVENETVDTVRACIQSKGGVMHGEDSQSTQLLTLLSYNHVTLRAKQADAGICHIQVGGAICREAPERVCAVLPEARLHLDGMRVGEGVGYGGLLISKFVDKQSLYAAMEALREMGCFVVDPHTWLLGAGHFPPLTMLYPIVDRNDPKGLLNPGKLPQPKGIRYE